MWHIAKISGLADSYKINAIVIIHVFIPFLNIPVYSLVSIPSTKHLQIRDGAEKANKDNNNITS